MGGEPAPSFDDHVAVLGRVAMALVGDVERAGAVLEEVAREAAARDSAGADLVPLLARVRAACAVHLSKRPLRNHSTAAPVASASARAVDSDAMAARRALAALRPTEREALVLSLVGGLTAPEVARACDVDEPTARTRLERAMQELASQSPSRTLGGGGDDR